MSGEILVRGEGEVRSLPDRAIVRVGVEADADSQAEAFSAASRSAATVDALLDKYAEAVDRRITAGVVVRPKTRWKRGENVKAGWIAGRTTVLEIKDLGKLGQLVSELPAAGASVIDGPSWEINRDNPAHDQARQAAAVDARRRAVAYAEALGLRLGALRWLSEPGLRVEGQQAVTMARAAGIFRRGPVPDEEPMDICPDEVTIAATVEACFELVSTG